MATIYVRVNLKVGVEKFHRCGMGFTRDWSKVEADDATAARLKAEQMLEVSEKEPDDFEAETPNAADPAGAASSGGKSGSDAPAPKKKGK